MAKIVCNKCGATGYSKCPICRNIFNDNQMDGLLSHLLKWKIENTKLDIRYTCVITERSKKENVAVALHSLRNLLNEMEREESPYPNIDQYSCNHNWVFAEGEKSDIGCGH